MKTIMTSQVTNGMFLLDTNAAVSIFSNHLMKKQLSIKMESQSPIIESIIEPIIEPIVFKC